MQIRVPALIPLLAIAAFAACADQPTGVEAGGTTFASVSVGGWADQGMACALTIEGAAYCWGSTWRGRLGNGITSDTGYSAPVRVWTGVRFALVEAGGVHSCGIGVDGTPYCWGWNKHRTILGSSNPDEPIPVPIPGLALDWIQASQHDVTCGLRDGTAWCWGHNDFGQLGRGTRSTNEPDAAPVAGGLSFRSLEVAIFHACGVTEDGRGFCWGHNPLLGAGPDVQGVQTTPVPVVGGLRFQRITGGALHTCGLTMDGRAYCWGMEDSHFQQFGDGPASGGDACSVPRSRVTVCRVPVPVVGGLTFAAIDAGWDHTCALTEDGTAYCWGDNRRGQLGTGAAGGSADSPVPVAGGHRFSQLSAGAATTCGLTPGGAIYCWGSGAKGALGNGSWEDSAVPVRVLDPKPRT